MCVNINGSAKMSKFVPSQGRAFDIYKEARQKEPKTRLVTVLPTAEIEAIDEWGVPNGMESRTAKHSRAVADIELGVAGIAGLVALSGSMAVAGAALGPLNTGLRIFLATLSKASIPSAPTAAASGAAPAAAVSTAARASTIFGRLLSGAGLAYEGYSLYEDQKARDNQLRETLRSHPKEAQQAQWLYDHSYGMFGLNMKVGQAQPATQVNVYVDGKQIAAHVEASQERRARQDMRASGTDPDLMQYAQYPGRSVGQ